MSEVPDDFDVSEYELDILAAGIDDGTLYYEDWSATDVDHVSVVEPETVAK